MRGPGNLIWKIIGDVFGQAFFGEKRRMMDSFWQIMFNLSGDAIDYLYHLRDLKVPLHAEWNAPYGYMPITPLSVGNRDDQIKCVMQWGYVNAQAWSWVLWTESVPLLSDGATPSLSQSGSIEVGSTSFDHFSLDIKKLYSGGFVLRASGLEKESAQRALDDKYGVYGLPAYSFNSGTSLSGEDRWEDILSYPVEAKSEGLVFTPPVLEWSGVRDKFHMDGGKNFKLIWVAQIKKWNPSAKTSTISVENFSDSGTPYHAMIRCQGGVAYIEAGLHESTVQLINSTEVDVFDMLSSATPANPVNLEICLDYKAIGSKIKTQIFINGNRFYSPSYVEVSPSRRQSNFNVFNSGGEMEVILEDVIAPYGDIWEADNPDSRDIFLYDSNFAFLYQIKEPLIECSGMRAAPYDLQPTAVLNGSLNEDRLSFTLDEGWSETAPEIIRLELSEDTWIMARLFSQEGRELVYSVFLRNIFTEGSDGQTFRLKPWFLLKDEISWIEPGVFKTKYSLPQEQENFWSIESRGVEVDLYNRFGTLLKLPKREDSLSYLGEIRGLYLGLRGVTSEATMERAVNLALEAPFTKEGGKIKSVTRIRDEIGRPLFDRVVVGSRVHDIPVRWANNGFLKPVGTRLKKFDTLIEGVQVDDYITNESRIDEIVSNIYEKWGIFAIQIPLLFGLTTEKLETIHVIAKSTKDMHRRYHLEQSNVGGLEEDMRTQVRDSTNHTNHTHTTEDMIFDDDDTVVGDSTGYEIQAWSENTLDLFQLDDGVALDSRYLTRPNVKRTKPGASMGFSYNFAPFQDEYYDYGQADTDIQRDSDAAFWTKRSLRMLNQGEVSSEIADLYGGGTIYGWTPRPYTLMWLFEDEAATTSLTMMPLPFDAEWSDLDVAPPISQDFHSISSLGPDDVSLFSSGSAVNAIEQRWDGTSWSAATISGVSDGIGAIAIAKGDVYDAALEANDLFGNNGAIAVGLAGDYSVRELSAGSWVYQGSVGSDNLLHVYVADGEIEPRHGWMVGENGSIYRWTGYSFTNTSIATTDSIRGVYSHNLTNAWICGDNSRLGYWDGSAWIDQSPGTVGNFMAIHGSDENNVWACTDTGRVYRWDGSTWSLAYNDATAVWRGVRVNFSNAWVVGDNGKAMRYDGLTFHVDDADSNMDFLDIELLGGQTPVWGVGIYSATLGGASQEWS